MSALLTGAIVMAVAALVSTAGFLVVSRYVPDRWLIADSDAAGALYASIGMVYAILIAIAAIAVWEPHDDASQSTRQEAGDLSEAYWSAGVLDPADATGIRALIVGYDRAVIDREWPALREHHRADPVTAQLFTALRTAAQAVRPAGDAQQNAAADVLARLADAADARRTRIDAADQGMPSLLWPTLVIGGIVSVAFLYLFGLERTFPNGLMMATVAAMTVLALFVVYQVEYPFSRALSIGSGPFADVLATLAGPS